MTRTPAAPRLARIPRIGNGDLVVSAALPNLNFSAHPQKQGVNYLKNRECLLTPR